MRRTSVFLVILAAHLVGAYFCVVILDERQQAFRTVLGDPEPRVLGFALNRPVLTSPGWYIRIPGLHNLQVYERRWQRYDASPHELYTAEKFTIEVDYYAIWRIADPRLFFESLRTYEEASSQLDDVTYGALRETLAQASLEDLLSPRRAELTRAIAAKSDATLRPRGIEVADLRIRRTDYPEKTHPQVFERMRSERQRSAKKARAEGEEAARRIRSEADRESQVVLAEAKRDVARLRGEGDARAAAIYAEAYNEDAEFYAFTRSLEAYRGAFRDKTTVVLSPQSPFLRYLFSNGRVPTPPSPAPTP